MPGRPVAHGPTRPPPLEAIYHSPFTRVTRLLEGRVCDRPACAVTPRLDIFFPSRSESSLGGTTRDGAVEGPVRSASRAVDRSFRRRTDADRGRPEPPGAETDTDPSDSQIFTERADKERPAAFLLIRPFHLPHPPPHRSRAREACVQGQHRPQLQGPHQDDRRAGRPRRLMRRRPSAHLNHRRVERPRRA